MTRSFLFATTALIAAFACAPGWAQTGAPAPAPAAEDGVLVFTPDFFADRQPNTALDMVNRVPGFTLNNGSGDRGFEGNVGNVLINGARPASKSDTATIVLTRTPASQVERIELIRGGAPGVDMQNYSVVVNVILKNENSSEHVVTFDSLFFNDGHPSLGGSYLFTARRGERSWSIRLGRDPNWSDSNGVVDVLRVDGAGIVLRDEVAISDAWGSNHNVRATYNGPLAGGKIDLTARANLNEWNNVEDQRAPGILRQSGNEEGGWNGEFGATWQRPLGERHELETRLIHQMGDWDGFSFFDETIGGALSEQRFNYSGASQESIVRALVRRNQNSELTLETGAELAYNMRDTEQELIVNGAVRSLPSDSVKVEEIRGEAFGRATWRPSSDWSLEGGLRLEASEISQSQGANAEKSFFYPKPRFLATWTPVENHQLRVRLEREVSQLNFRDFSASAQLANDVVFGGNVELVPSQRWIAEAVYEHRFWDEGVISVGYRHDEISDVIDTLLLPGGIPAIGNIGSGTLDRLSVNLLLPTDRLGIPGGRFGFNSNWDDMRVTDPTTGRPRTISNQKPVDARLTFEQDIPSWKIRWGLFWLPQYDRPRFNPDQYSTFRLTDYQEWFIEYKPDATLTITARVTLWDHGLGERLVYADPVTQTVSYLETRDLDANTFWRLTVRKTF